VFELHNERGDSENDHEQVQYPGVVELRSDRVGDFTNWSLLIFCAQPFGVGIDEAASDGPRYRKTIGRTINSTAIGIRLNRVNTV